MYKTKIKELVGHERFLDDLQRARLRPSDHEAPNYDHPALIIRFTPGSMWTNELHMQRYQLRKLLNDRLKSEFIKEVRVK